MCGKPPRVELRGFCLAPKSRTMPPRKPTPNWAIRGGSRFLQKSSANSGFSLISPCRQGFPYRSHFHAPNHAPITEIYSINLSTRPMTSLLDTKFIQIFVKSPVTVLLLLSVIALAYSQQQNDKLYQQQISEYKEELKEVRSELKALQDKVFDLKK